MSDADKMRELLARMVFIRRDMERLVEEIREQGFRTEDQDANAEMLVQLADEIQEEVNLLTGAAIPDVFCVTTEHTCMHCGKPVRREAGLWLHVSTDDFFRCGKVGIPRSSRGEI